MKTDLRIILDGISYYGNFDLKTKKLIKNKKLPSKILNKINKNGLIDKMNAFIEKHKKYNIIPHYLNLNSNKVTYFTNNNNLKFQFSINNYNGIKATILSKLDGSNVYLLNKYQTDYLYHIIYIDEFYNIIYFDKYIYRFLERNLSKNLFKKFDSKLKKAVSSLDITNKQFNWLPEHYKKILIFK